MTVPFCRCGKALRPDVATWTGRPWWRCDTGAGKRCKVGRAMTRGDAEKHRIPWPSDSSRRRGRWSRVVWLVDRAARGGSESGVVGAAQRVAESVGDHEARRIMLALADRLDRRATEERTPDRTWGVPSRAAPGAAWSCAWCGGVEFEQPAALALRADGARLVAVEWRARRTDVVACATCGGVHRETRRGLVADPVCTWDDERLDNVATSEAA